MLFALLGKLAPGVIHVMAHSIPASVPGSHINQAATLSFSGDDVLTLMHSGAVIDRIGQVSYRPPSGFWGTTSTDTKDHTLRRQGTVKAGDTGSTAASNPPLQWDALNIDNFSGPGLYNGQSTITPPPAVATCGASAAHLVDIQDVGATSPLVGLSIEIEAVATANHSGVTGFNGFFV